MLCLTLATNVLTTCTDPASACVIELNTYSFPLNSINRAPYLEDPQQPWKGPTFHAKLTLDKCASSSYRIGTDVYPLHCHSVRTLLGFK